MSEKKLRLFVACPTTEMVSCICGGPDIDAMLEGLGNIMKPEVTDMVEQAKALEGSRIDGDIELTVKWMTDEEVDALPDIW